MLNFAGHCTTAKVKIVVTALVLTVVVIMENKGIAGQGGIEQERADPYWGRHSFEQLTILSVADIHQGWHSSGLD